MKTPNEEFVDRLFENKGGTQSITTEQLINHEVRLRVNEYKSRIHTRKLNWVIGLLVTGMIIPIFLHICWDFYEAIFTGIS